MRVLFPSSSSSSSISCSMQMSLNCIHVSPLVTPFFLLYSRWWVLYGHKGVLTSTHHAIVYVDHRNHKNWSTASKHKDVDVYYYYGVLHVFIYFINASSFFLSLNRVAWYAECTTCLHSSARKSQPVKEICHTYMCMMQYNHHYVLAIDWVLTHQWQHHRSSYSETCFIKDDLNRHDMLAPFYILFTFQCT